MMGSPERKRAFQPLHEWFEAEGNDVGDDNDCYNIFPTCSSSTNDMDSSSMNDVGNSSTNDMGDSPFGGRKPGADGHGLV